MQSRKNEGPVRFVGYVRVSTEEQATHGVSLDAQVQRLEAYAVALGHELVGIERDEGVSGSVDPMRRPGLAKALQAIKDGEADGLVFYKLDRLSRQARDILALTEMAKRQRWHLCSVTEQFDTSTATGKFVLSMFASLAELELDQIKERTRFGLAQVAREGRAMGSRIPFGYRIEGKPDDVRLAAGDRGKLVEHVEEQAIRQEIIAMSGQGHGACKIATLLNRRGMLNPRTQRPWSIGVMISVMKTIQRRQRLDLPAYGSDGEA